MSPHWDDDDTIILIRRLEQLRAEVPIAKNISKIQDPKSNPRGRSNFGTRYHIQFSKINFKIQVQSHPMDHSIGFTRPFPVEMTLRNPNSGADPQNRASRASSRKAEI